MGVAGFHVSLQGVEGGEVGQLGVHMVDSFTLNGLGQTFHRAGGVEIGVVRFAGEEFMDGSHGKGLLAEGFFIIIAQAERAHNERNVCGVWRKRRSMSVAVEVRGRVW